MDWQRGTPYNLYFATAWAGRAPAALRRAGIYELAPFRGVAVPVFKSALDNPPDGTIFKVVGPKSAGNQGKTNFTMLLSG